MKDLKITNFSFILILSVLIFACSGKGDQNQKVEQPEQIEVNIKSQALLDYLVEMGDYVNSRNFPSLIKVSSVYEELSENNHIIDLRDEDSFSEGHVKDAVNVDFSDLPDYMTSEIKPFEFKRIVLVCYSGQLASYATSLLRLMGYGNVYSMRWGMSGWNKKFASDRWLDNLSSDYEESLETIDNTKAEIVDFPELNTNETVGEQILSERIEKLFNDGMGDALISADEVFDSLSNYYIINYERRDKYESGHIPGAIRYKPNGTLGIVKEMQTIPADKEVVVYCNTGHNSGFVTAYLRLFGYDAKTLTYGNNSFMYNKMIEEKEILSWKPFTDDEIKNYPFESK